MLLGISPSTSGTAEDQFKDELEYYDGHYDIKKLTTNYFNTIASNLGYIMVLI